MTKKKGKQASFSNLELINWKDVLLYVWEGMGFAILIRWSSQ